MLSSRLSSLAGPLNPSLPSSNNQLFGKLSFELLAKLLNEPLDELLANLLNELLSALLEMARFVNELSCQLLDELLPALGLALGRVLK